MSLAARRSVFWLEARADDDSPEGLAARVEALGLLSRDLDGRLQQAGAGGLAGAVATHRRLRGVLDAVSFEELRSMRENVALLQGKLAAIERRVAALRTLKAELDRVDPA
jgi:hypothetical protein